MFFKFKRKVIFFLLFLFIPLNVYAYSKEIIAGGENIGITLNSNGVMIVGTYEVNGINPALESGLKAGDFISEIDGHKVQTIDDMAQKIGEDDDGEVSIKYMRNKSSKETKLKLYKDESGIFKTGLFVKDSITGIGTLTFIDPNTKKFGALGHEILEQATGKLLEIKDGKIFDSTVTDVIPSNDGTPGEKKAEFNEESVKGIAHENTTQGIFGDYVGNYSGRKTYKVLNPSDVFKGKAKILTVLNGTEVKEFDIVITQINSTTQKNKNFIFEITDEELLKSTNGIIQGMSGSPIVRGDNIIGAVTHVVVNDPHKGYGIFITNMLEESEK